jgi:hypothetical protein
MALSLEFLMKDQSSSQDLVQRRAVVKSALLAVAVIPAASLCVGRTVYAAAAPLDEKDPQAKALGYVADAGRVDAKSNPTYKPGQLCSNCLQVTGNAGDAFRPCNLFPGKVVAANGWCKAWVKKP